MNTVNYSHPSGQYIGAIVTEEEINLESNYFADMGCVVVPSMPPSIQWFWDFDKSEWYLPPLTAEEIAADERAWRDRELASVVWLRERHRDQVEIGGGTTLATEQFQGLLLYMQALRDWPQSEQFPVSEHRPVAPPWVAEQYQ
uniref:phage tail assembly chaperone n=1 Tax=Pseudomonas laurentiana TaxID=2364649 RepID=UPI0029C6B886|nr:phage tail assembly chaperone [Pseudomonas laurentiana]